MSYAYGRIAELLQSCGTPEGVLPPTALYNEGWMLRLVLDWFSRQPPSDHPLAFDPGARWYSEVLLPTQFRARWRGDDLAESWTHADGVVGHVRTPDGRGDVRLEPAARQLVVVEAKLFSGLSAGVMRAAYFDQAARSVACIAEMLHRANLAPTTLDRVGFVVLAPAEQLEREVFGDLCSTASIAEKVRQRAAAYDGAKETWYAQWFMPLLERVNIVVQSWEQVVDVVAKRDPVVGPEMRVFLDRCLRFNRPAAATRRFSQ